MKSVLGYYSALFLLLATFTLPAEKSAARIETVLGDVALEKNPNLAALPSVKSSEVIISRDQYVISYNKERRSPNWVAWKVDSSRLGDSGRSDAFFADSDLQTYLEKLRTAPPVVTPDEYKGSCFDRGHLAPSADRTDSAEDNQSTFVMSNMVPQTPYLNRFLWQQLESFTRELVAKGKNIYAIAGPVYDQNFGAIGPNRDIPIPSKSFKILILLNKDQTPKDITQKTTVIAILAPNVLKNGNRPSNHSALCGDTSFGDAGGPNEWRRYMSTVAEIEQVTGLTLRPLP